MMIVITGVINGNG